MIRYLLVAIVLFAIPVSGATYEETRRAEQAKHERLMDEARKERALEKEREYRSKELEKDRQSKERIEKYKAKADAARLILRGR